MVWLIGKREWRQTLKARSRADAEREAIPLLDETNRTIDLALAGNWPPISDDEIEAVAIGWWSEFRETRLGELRRRKAWTVNRLWDVDASEWALADANELARSVEQFIAGPRNLDYVFRPELDLITALLDDPKRASGLVRNKDAMTRLLRDCRLHHHAVAGAWGDELRERSHATDRVLSAIHAGKVEPHEIIASMIEKKVATSPEPQARRVGGKSPVLFNHPNGGDDLIAKWAKWRKPRPGIDGTIHRTVARRRLAGPGPRGWSITLLSRKGGAGKTRGVPNPGRYHPRDLMRVPIDEKMRPLRAPERYPGRDFPDSQILSGSPITITKNTAVLGHRRVFYRAVQST